MRYLPALPYGIAVEHHLSPVRHRRRRHRISRKRLHGAAARRACCTRRACRARTTRCARCSRGTCTARYACGSCHARGTRGSCTSRRTRRARFALGARRPPFTIYDPLHTARHAVHPAPHVPLPAASRTTIIFGAGGQSSRQCVKKLQFLYLK